MILSWRSSSRSVLRHLITISKNKQKIIYTRRGLSTLSKVTSYDVLERLDKAIENSNKSMDTLLTQYGDDFDKVKRKFHIIDDNMNGDVILQRKKIKNEEYLMIKFNCEAEVTDFDDDDGYDRILHALEMAEEKNLDYSDKIALGDPLEGMMMDVLISKRQQRLTFNCIAWEKIVVQKVYFDSPLSIKGDQKELKRLYNGPKYINLEEPLRIALQEYLGARLVDDFLSQFIVNYSNFKRCREFSLWAENMKRILVQD